MADIRYLNSFGMSGGFNITNAEPIDSRMYVNSIDDIKLAANWTKVKPYNGLIVASKDGEVRVCVDADNYTLDSAWKKIGGAEADGTYITKSADDVFSLNTAEVAKALAGDTVVVSNGKLQVGATIVDRRDLDGSVFDVPDNALISIKYASDTQKGVAKFQKEHFTVTNGDVALNAATKTTLGGVKVGDNLTVASDGTIGVPYASTEKLGVVMPDATYFNFSGNETNADTYKLQVKTATKLSGTGTAAAIAATPGVVRVGENIDLGTLGVISVKTGSKADLGVVKVGDNINVDSGVISVPVAAAGQLGVVMPGDGLEVDANGKLKITLDHTLFEVVSALPSSNINSNKIYLVASVGEEGDKYSEYIYANGAWEKLGSFKADVSLEGYATETYVSNQLKNYVTISALNTQVASLESEIGAARDEVNAAIDMADTAQVTANKGVANAATAQTTADKAVDNAAAAQKAAEDAQSTADNANSLASQANAKYDAIKEISTADITTWAAEIFA